MSDQQSERRCQCPAPTVKVDDAGVVSCAACGLALDDERIKRLGGGPILFADAASMGRFNTVKPSKP
jgi:hypothetical protein